MLKIPLSMLAAGAVLVVSAPAWAVAPPGPTLVPFHGSYSGNTVARFAPPQVFVTGTGEGHATHLGRFDLAFAETLRLGQVVAGCSTPGTTGTSTGSLTAANGDTVMFEGSGTGCPTSATTVRAMAFHTVTGGTGRFEGASGYFTLIVAVDRPTSTVVATFDGELSTPGSIK